MIRAIDSVARLKRIPVGTKLYLVATLMGAQDPSERTVHQVRSKDIVMRIDDPSHKNYGKLSYASLPSGTKVMPTANGFAIYEPKASEEELRLNPHYPGGELAAEYEFADE